ncbi:MAG: hypothetical protein AB8G16_14590 [Gammaproteobacteria bacterium]
MPEFLLPSLRRVLSVFLCVFALALCAPPTLADELPPERGFPGEPDSRFSAELKRDAERAYERGDFARAYRIYSKGLVWRGDKYAQYMTGVMNFKGEGTRADRALGVAWLKLAAERNNPTLHSVYEDGLSRLSAAENDRLEREYERIAADYGDRRVLERLIRRDRLKLRRITGSRTGYSANLPLTIVNLDGSRVPGDKFFGAIRKRLNTRMGYLGGVVELGEFEVIDDESESAAEDDASE